MAWIFVFILAVLLWAARDELKGVRQVQEFDRELSYLVSEENRKLKRQMSDLKTEHDVVTRQYLDLQNELMDKKPGEVMESINYFSYEMNAEDMLKRIEKMFKNMYNEEDYSI